MHSKRTLARAVATLAGILAILAVSSASAGAAIHSAGGTFRCQGSDEYGPWSPISAGVNTYIIGNCAPGTILGRTYYERPTQQNGPYFGGYVSGSFNGCGAVQVRNLSARVTPARTSICTDGRKRNPADFLSVVDCKGSRTAPCRRWDPKLHGDHDTVVVKTCQAYANVRPFGVKTAELDPVQVISPENSADPSRPGKFRVWWRYVTKDLQWVLVHDLNGRRAGHPSWVFVRAGCVSSPNPPMAP